MSRHALHDDIHEVLAFRPPAHPNEIAGKHEFIPGWPFVENCGACGFTEREESKDPYHYTRNRRQADDQARCMDCNGRITYDSFGRYCAYCGRKP